MTQHLAVEPPETEAATHDQKMRIVAKFLRWWLGSVLALVVVALLTNIEWARPHIESALEQSFHRTARLGRLSWHLGLNGLSIEASRFVLEDLDGSRFIESGPSQMGIAFLPLFENRIIIKHVAFGSPEVWATKVAPDRWNFSDLLTAGPEIRLVQIEDGTLHLSNRSPNAKWKKYELNNIDLKFGFPRKEKETWPLYFDCKVPVERNGRTEISSIKLSATGTGSFEEWKKRPYLFNLEVNNFNPRDFRPLNPDLPDADGNFSFKMKGAGIFEKGLNATISGSVSELVLPTPEDSGSTRLPVISVTSDIVAGENLVSWKNADVTLDEWKIKSTGKLQDFSDKVKYQARIDGELGDLQGLYTRVLSRFFPVAHSAELARFNKPGVIGRGSATLALQLKGTSQDHELSSTIRAEGIPLQDLLDLGVKEYASFLPDLKPDSPVSGEIQLCHGHVRSEPAQKNEAGAAKKTAQQSSKFVPETASIINSLPVNRSFGLAYQKVFLYDHKNKPRNFREIALERTSKSNDKKDKLITLQDQPLTVAVKDLEVPFEGTVLRLNGRMDAVGHQGEVEFAIKNLDAQSLTKLPKEALDEQTRQALNARKLKGKLDLVGKVQLVGNQRKIAVQSILNGVSLCSAGGAILAQDVQGELAYDGKQLTLTDIKGMLPSKNIPYGQFAVKGNVVAGGEQISLVVSGNQLEVSKLRELVREAGFAIKGAAAGVSFDRMTGKVQDLKLQLEGSATNLSVAFTLIGPDLQVEREDSRGKRTFRLSSGLIDHHCGQTTIKDLIVASPGAGGKLTVSAQFQGSLDKARLKSIALATDGLDLAEWRSFLAPSLLPDDLLESLPVAFRPIKNAPVQGRLYGDIKIAAVADGYEADGVFGFQNAATRVGSKSISLEKLTGVIAFSPKEVILQDLSGNYGRSSFSLDGRISDYRQKFNWNGQLKGKFYPEEFAAINRAIGAGLDLETTEKEPVALRLAGAGIATDYKLSFNGHSEPGDGLRLIVGSVGIYQPVDLPLTFDGGVRVKTEAPSSIEMERCIILAGDHCLKLQGSITDSGTGSGSMADMKLTTPEGMPISLLLRMLYPDKTLDAIGHSDLSLAFTGPVDGLRLNGALKLSAAAVPSLGVTNLNAKLELPNFALKPNSAEAEEPSRLTISTARVGGFDIRDGEVEVVASGGENVRLSLRNGEAKIAGGKIKLSGFFEPGSSKYHAELSMAKLAVREFVDDFIKGDGKVSGQADVNLVLNGEGGSSWMNNLNGKGKFSVYEGTIQTVGKLQGKLHGANLLQQGLLGFNINNFIQAVHPSKTGTFKEIDGEVSIRSGVIGLKQVRYDGNDLRMRAAGEVNLPAGTVEIDVAGDIPRVATSMIPGAVGEMSREMTLQKLLGIVTFKQLEDLPSLPLLGEIASDHPRVFSFVVNAPLDKPELISRSVEKSFKWIPAKPYASAHPVPGL